MYGYLLSKKCFGLAKTKIFEIFQEYETLPDEKELKIIFNPDHGDLFLVDKSKIFFDGNKYLDLKEMLDGNIIVKIQKSSKMKKVTFALENNKLALINYTANSLASTDNQISDWELFCEKRMKIDSLWNDVFKNEEKKEFENYKNDIEYLENLKRKLENEISTRKN